MRPPGPHWVPLNPGPSLAVQHHHLFKRCGIPDMLSRFQNRSYGKIAFQGFEKTTWTTTFKDESVLVKIDSKLFSPCAGSDRPCPLLPPWNYH